MVEVVQDLLDYVTYAGGVGRRRADAVSGLGAGTPKPSSNDCAVVAEDPDDPRGPRIVRLEDLVFHEMLDKPVDEKGYRLQLEEFAFRGDRLMNQLDQQLSQVCRLVEHDVLWRSRLLPKFLRLVCDHLRQAHVLICQELLEVWHIKFEPFFYPSEDEERPGDFPGGWLDLDDMFLTVHLLVRHLAEMVSLAGDLIDEVPEESRASREQLSCQPLPEVELVVQACSKRVPWLGVSTYRAQSPKGSAQPSGSNTPEDELPLSQAVTVLDEVLTIHMNNLLSDLHRTTYQTFVRVCHAYTRWKRAFAAERQKKLQEIAEAEAAAKRKRRVKGKAGIAAAPSPELEVDTLQGESDRGSSKEMSESSSGSPDRRRGSRKSLVKAGSDGRRGSGLKKRGSSAEAGSSRRLSQFGSGSGKSSDASSPRRSSQSGSGTGRRMSSQKQEGRRRGSLERPTHAGSEEVQDLERMD